MAFKQIDKHLWLSLMVEQKAIGNSYCVQYLVKKDSKKRRVISHSDREYKKIWNDIIKDMPELDTFLRHDWIEDRLKKMTKWTSPHHGPYRQMIEWGNTPMGNMAKKFEQYIEKKDVTREHKSRMHKHVRLIVDKSGSKTTLTTQTLQDCVDHLHDKKDPRSISYIRAFLGTAKRFSKYSKLRGMDEVFGHVELPTTERVESKNRQYFRLDEVVKLIKLYANEEDEVVRSSFFFQLWSGCRPAESYDITITPDEIVRNANKTKTKVKLPKTALFEAYIVLTGIGSHKVSGRKEVLVAEKFQEYCHKAGITKEHGAVDRYWLRHTAITWMLNSISSHFNIGSITKFAGHANIRMIGDHYAKKAPDMVKPWGELMPLKIKNLPDGYHRFIFEQSLLAFYPSIISKKPIDDRYKQVQAILSPVKQVKEEFEL